jgi:hypothetical protein
MSWPLASRTSSSNGPTGQPMIGRTVSTIRFVVRDPAVQPSGVRPVRCPVTRVRRPGPAIRPAAVQRLALCCPPVRCPAVCCPPPSVRSRPSPATSGVALGPGRGGRATVTTGTGRGPGGLPRRRAAGSTAQQAWTRATLPRSRGGQWGVGGGPGWVGGRRRPRVPAAQPGRPGRRAVRPVAGGCAVGRGAGSGASWPHRPGGCRPRAGWATTVGGGRGAGPSGGPLIGVQAGMGCGPSAAQAGSGRSRLAADSAVTCGNGWWACQDLNLGPHPYQRSTAKRRAIPHPRRSCRSVDATRMG